VIFPLPTYLQRLLCKMKRKDKWRLFLEECLGPISG